MGEATQSQQIVQRPCAVAGREIAFEETADFPREDPWSELTREVIEGLKRDGRFDGQNFFEAGLGDGRNALLALDIAGEGGASRLTGIELDDWRLAAAARNLTVAGVDPDRLNLHQADVVEWLQADGHAIRGWSLACLPQAPRIATENDADGYQEFHSLDPFHGMTLEGRSVDTYGLTLNAAYLTALRRRAEPGDLNALLTLSDRVPPTVLNQLFANTGWEIAEIYPSEEPVQQDPDTGIGWIASFDDGERFHEKDGDGQFAPIPVQVAEARRRSSLVTYGEEARDQLNVYHGLAVYHLQPGSEV